MLFPETLRAQESYSKYINEFCIFILDFIVDHHCKTFTHPEFLSDFVSSGTVVHIRSQYVTMSQFLTDFVSLGQHVTFSTVR